VRLLNEEKIITETFPPTLTACSLF